MFYAMSFLCCLHNGAVQQQINDNMRRNEQECLLAGARKTGAQCCQNLISTSRKLWHASVVNLKMCSTVYARNLKEQDYYWLGL